MGINNSKLNCASKKAREEPYRQVRRVDDEIKEENGDQVGYDKKNRERKLVPEDNSSSRSPSKVLGQSVQERKDQVQNGEIKAERNTSTKSSKSTTEKMAVKKKKATHKKESKQMYSDDESFNFVKAIKTDYKSGSFQTSKVGSTEAKRDRTVNADETNPKSVNNPAGSVDETELKQSYGPSPADGEDTAPSGHSSLEKDCLPSMDSEDGPEGQRQDFADAYTTDHNGPQEKSKKIIPESKDDEDTTDSDDSDGGDDDSGEEDEEGGNGGTYNFGHVTSMIIGTGKIIDKETIVTSKVSSRSKNSSKAKHRLGGKNRSKDRKKSEPGSKKSQGKTVNAASVRNLGIGKVTVKKETVTVEHPQSEPTRAKIKPPKTEPLMPGLPVTDMDDLGKVTDSVGMIHGYTRTGSVFRVGKDKVITAWHVVRGMICTDNLSRKLDQNRLADPSVYVDFGYEEEYRPDRMKRFPVEPCVVYWNEKLDIAVLQLKHNDYGTAFPKPLTNFDKFTQELHENYPIYLVGHTNALRKSLDFIMKYWHPFDHRIKELSEWYEDEFEFKHGYGFTGIKDQTRLHFQCSFRHGASGCPGFIVRSKGDIRVVTVLLRGFPDFYYFDNFTQEERNRVPTAKLIQQGSDMEAIWEDMKSKNWELYREIFQYHDYISHSEKNKPVDTPSEEKVLNFPSTPASTESERKTKSPGAAVTCIPRVASGQDPLVMLASGKSKTIAGSGNIPTESTADTGEKQSEATSSTLEIPVEHERVQSAGNNTCSTEGSQIFGERNNISVQALDDGQTVRSSGVYGSRGSTSSYNRQMSEVTTSALESQCAEVRQQANSNKSASASKVW